MGGPDPLDPPRKYATDAGRGSTSYLSSTIFEEVISKMAEKSKQIFC
jgi:hypothetical protein